jgi:hypothetical protein
LHLSCAEVEKAQRLTAERQPSGQFFNNMLRFHELRQNPATVTFCDMTGARITVTAERLRRGLVNMTCQCAHYSGARWCSHCVTVLCDRVILEDNEQSLALRGIVEGTRLKAMAHVLEAAVETFSIAYRHMMQGRPATLDPVQLNDFATKTYQASIAARQVALAIESFVEELRPTAAAK